MVDERVAAIGARIREVRQLKGMTLEDLAEKVSRITGKNTHFTTIAKIERSGQKIAVDWIIVLAEALGVHVQELMAEPNREPVRMVPILGGIAAGNWREAISEEHSEYLPIPTSAAGPNAFGLRPIGDSMNNLVNDRTVLVVDPDQFDLLDGKLYAVMNGDGYTTFKRYRSDPPRLEPDSSNPEHKAIMIGREPFTVIGRVQWRMEKLD